MLFKSPLLKSLAVKMKTLGNWLLILSIPFGMGAFNINVMGSIATHGGGFIFALILYVSSICSIILIIYSIITVIIFVRNKNKEDYFPIIIYPLFMVIQIIAWVQYESI